MRGKDWEAKNTPIDMKNHAPTTWLFGGLEFKRVECESFANFLNCKYPYPIEAVAAELTVP